MHDALITPDPTPEPDTAQADTTATATTDTDTAGNRCRHIRRAEPATSPTPDHTLTVTAPNAH